MRLIFFSAFIGIVCASDIVKQKLIVTEPIVIESPGYPRPFSDRENNYGWALSGCLGCKISVNCDELNLKESTNCEDASLLIRDGINKRVFCGKKTDISFTTTHPILIYMNTRNGEGYFRCKVQLINSISKEHSTFLKENQLSIINLKGMAENYGDSKTWVVSTKPGLKLKLFCKKISLHNIGNNKPQRTCGADVIEMDVGDEIKKECWKTSMKSFKIEGNRLVLRVTRSLDVYADIDCVVTATEKDDEIHYKWMPSEEVDSREFGMKAGSKKTTCDCGRANKRAKKRVIFGTDAEENEFPWAVSLHYRSTVFHFCGGSIVTPRHVISAAHCTENKRPEDVDVIAGATHLFKSTGRQVYPVIRIINHDYQRTPTRRDITVLITRDRIVYSATVGPICLPKTDPKMVQKYITAVGWGQMAKNETMRDKSQLKKAHMRVVSPFDCSVIWNDQHHDPELSQICTFSNHRDICLGDSGGPVTWVDPDTNRYFLVGLPSLCDGCILRLPSIHTAVHFYYDWIQKVISENEAHDEKTCTKVD